MGIVDRGRCYLALTPGHLKIQLDWYKTNLIFVLYLSLVAINNTLKVDNKNCTIVFTMQRGCCIMLYEPKFFF